MQTGVTDVVRFAVVSGGSSSRKVSPLKDDPVQLCAPQVLETCVQEFALPAVTVTVSASANVLPGFKGDMFETDTDPPPAAMTALPLGGVPTAVIV